MRSITGGGGFRSSVAKSQDARRPRQRSPGAARWIEQPRLPKLTRGLPSSKTVPYVSHEPIRRKIGCDQGQDLEIDHNRIDERRDACAWLRGEMPQAPLQRWKKITY